MTFDEIFAAYYTLYRTEATIPNSEDDEYTIALSLANEAVNRWSNYDNTYWRELFTTRVIADDGDSAVTSETTYECPDDMREVGGYVMVKDDDGNILRRYPVIEPQMTQFRSDMANYAYFTGDPNNGFTLTLNPAPDTAIIGKTLDYVYYKKPTLMEDGTSVVEMSQPYFVVHRMLANRFRGSRNPYYNSAKQDAEDALRTMQLENNSGSWANPWSLQDNSGTSWGE